MFTRNRCSFTKKLNKKRITLFDNAMGEKKERVIVNDHVFFNFEKASDSAVKCIIEKVNGSRIEDTDRNVVEEIINKIGLWENYIEIKKAEKFEIGNGEYTVVEDNYRENMLLLRDFSIDDQHWRSGSHIISVRFSPEESLRRTQGKSRVADITVEYIIDGLINVNKWLILQKSLNFFT